jgi:hypothetical protein
VRFPFTLHGGSHMATKKTAAKPAAKSGKKAPAKKTTKGK